MPMTFDGSSCRYRVGSSCAIMKGGAKEGKGARIRQDHTCRTEKRKAQESPSGGLCAPCAATGRSPTCVEDLLWNIHCTLRYVDRPLSIHSLEVAYYGFHGHYCDIRRFLVVQNNDITATLRRVPHVVAVTTFKDGKVYVDIALLHDTDKEGLLAANREYRRRLHSLKMRTTRPT